MKVSKRRKFEDLILKTVALVKFLKTANLTENVPEFALGGDAMHPASIPCKIPYILF